ncbi:DNA polymerase III subunit epsilon [Cellulomonas sp. APG4]|uniref:exonuclease domain-containing protein n=1 Tax=Cellulomonas sp. APG4 TaxID=1538656 RepID=UPI0013799860|nr:exonuclease domain-containing protein [Cellulomonas sp. APG4]NCT90781.1 DNA polymerase III subunit epsilon [Cellulomonas sp. APG4]
MALDFVAFDWETANGARGSACAVGLVRVRDGQVVSTWSSLLRPPAPFAGFDPANTAVHGLCADDVTEAPSFAEAWPTVESWLVADTAVAHNARFDLDVVKDATWASGLHCPRLRYGCTLTLARRHFDLPSYGLDVVAEAAGVTLEAHHDALADARAAAEVLLRVCSDVGATSVEEAFDAHGIGLGWSTGPEAVPCRVVGRSRWHGSPRGTAQHVEPTLW